MMQLIWGTVLIGHAGGALAWWWFMPGGFPTSHPAFWVNQIAPFVVLGVIALALFVRGPLGDQLRRPIFASFPIFWIAFALAARIAFPHSFESMWMLPMFAGVALVAAWLGVYRPKTLRDLLLVVAVAPAAFAGTAFAMSQRAANPDTHPANVALAPAPPNLNDHGGIIRVGKEAQIHPPEGRVVIRGADATRPLTLTVQSILAFGKRSSDGCWLGFASDYDNVAEPRKLVSKSHDGAHWKFWYRDANASVLDIAAIDHAITIESRTSITQPLYTHLNDFTTLAVTGHRQLSIAFSSIPNQRFEIPPPGRAATFAYLDNAGVLHVMKAAKQKRGPFAELASGPIGRTAPLVITLYDEGAATFRIRFDDWAAQASTQLSPAAGDGIPVNAIEFTLLDAAATSPAIVSLSLASSSIGRGDQTVGHAAGTYRNRVTIETP